MYASRSSYFVVAVQKRRSFPDSKNPFIMQLLACSPLVLWACTMPAIAIGPAPLLALPHQRNQSIPTLRTVGVHDIRCLDSRFFSPSECDPAACNNIIDVICTSLTRPDPLQRRWTWASTTGCAFGSYISTFPQGIARRPTIRQCKEKVFGQLVELCASQSSPRKIGVVNVKILPYLHTGTATREGWRRFILAEKTPDGYDG